MRVPGLGDRDPPAGALGIIRSPLARRIALSQPLRLALFVVLAALYAAGAVAWPQWFTIGLASLLLLIGGFFLRMRPLLLYFAVVAVVAVVAVIRAASSPPSKGGTVTLIVTGLLVLLYVRSRERVGLQGSLGDTMLVDLRGQLEAQGVVPPLPPGWQCETVLRAAYGDSFSGDFLVATRPGSGGWLELALVDVAGKGQAAGTRALMLSGALGGLLGALPREEFLPAANRYLLRRAWDEGFATALHVGVDLVTGRFRLASAGHPPAAQFHAGSGTWSLIESGQGPLLGVLQEPEFPSYLGVLEHGDALLLYTDGLVENRGRDIALGIDRLVGEAERVMTSGFSGGAARIVDGTRSSEGDDRALVLIWRT